MSWWDHPDCVCVCLSLRLHNKGQHLGEATKIFLEYRILSIPVDKRVSVMTVWKLDSNEKSPLDVNLIVWGEAAMTHVWWPPFGSLFDFRKHNGDKAPEESWKLIHKTYPSKTQVPKHWRMLWVWVHFKSSFIHTMPVSVWKNSTFNLLNAFSIPIKKSVCLVQI